MKGLLHIVLARKPIEGTVAENCLQWGCGALWIDGTRVATDWNTDSTRRGWQGTAVSRSLIGFDGISGIKNPSSLGRWPANLILGHCENCRRQGTKKVKGNAPVASGYDRLNKKQAELGYRPGEYQKGEVEPGYCHTDVDGKETVEVWDCEKNCVTMGFPDSNSQRNPRGRSDVGGGIWGKSGGKPVRGDIGDSGTAARFFFNFSEQESDE